MKIASLIIAGLSSASAKNVVKRSDLPCGSNDGPFQTICALNQDEKACTSGKLCCWDGENCNAKVQNEQEAAMIEGCDLEEEGDIGKCVLKDEEFSKNLVERKEMKDEEIEALKETVGALKEDDDGSDEAKSGLLDLFTLSSLSGGMGGGVGGMGGMASMINPSLMGVTQLMDSKFFTCPINIPHCQRIACYGEPGKNPQHNAMDCFGIPGCCFDSKAYQYKYLLGEQALKAPTCYKAIRTPMFHYFANNLAGKSPFVPNFLTYITSKVEDYIENDTTFPLLTRAHRCVNPSDFMSRIQLESYLARIWPAYTMMSLLDKKKDGNNKFLGSIVDAFSTQCGWKRISKTECMLIGCCYNTATNFCSHASDITKIDPDRLVQTIQHLMMTGLIEDKAAEDIGAPDPPKSGTAMGAIPTGPIPASTGSIPGSTGANSGSLNNAKSLDFLLNGLTGRKRRSARTRRQFEDIRGPEDDKEETNNGARSLNLMSLMGGMGNMGGMGDMGGMGMNPMGQFGMNPMGMNQMGMNGAGMNPLMASLGGAAATGENGAKMGGLSDLAMMSMMSQGGDSNLAQTMLLAQSLNGQNGQMGGAAGQLGGMGGAMGIMGGMAGLGNSMLGLNGNMQTCSANLKMDCMESPDGDGLDLNTLFKLQQKCSIKGCCWDSAKAQQMTLQKNFDSMNEMMKLQCPYNIPVSIGGLPDLTDDMRGCCDFSPCVHTAPPADWTNWGEWSSCSENCGGGIMRRSRSCEGHGSCPGMTSDDREQVVEQQCNLQPCESWSEWSMFGPCNTSCGPGNQMRSRSCFSIKLNQEIMSAPGCVGLAVESKSCDNQSCPTWTAWSMWSTCSVSCGLGQRLRKRSCTHPGLCPGDSVQYERCGSSCFSEWSMWSLCSASCLGGQQRRMRDCIYSAETGSDCIGVSDETRSCASNYCETWMSWGEWSQCMGTNAGQICGTGSRSRSRDCTGTPGAPGCVGDLIATTQCSLGICNWSEWTMASACETTRPGCGRGKATYVRSCPGGPGACSGASSSSMECNLAPCPGFSEWAEWSECSVTCGIGMKQRSRTCNGVMNVDCLGSTTMKATCEAPQKCATSGWGSSNTWGNSWGSNTNTNTNSLWGNTNTNQNTNTNSNTGWFSGMSGLFGGQQADTTNLFNGQRQNNGMNMWSFVGRRKRSDNE